MNPSDLASAKSTLRRIVEQWGKADLKRLEAEIEDVKRRIAEDAQYADKLKLNFLVTLRHCNEKTVQDAFDIIENRWLPRNTTERKKRWAEERSWRTSFDTWIALADKVKKVAPSFIEQRGDRLIDDNRERPSDPIPILEEEVMKGTSAAWKTAERILSPEDITGARQLAGIPDESVRRNLLKDIAAGAIDFVKGVRRQRAEDQRVLLREMGLSEEQIASLLKTSGPGNSVRAVKWATQLVGRFGRHEAKVFLCGICVMDREERRGVPFSRERILNALRAFNLIVTEAEYHSSEALLDTLAGAYKSLKYLARDTDELQAPQS